VCWKPSTEYLTGDWRSVKPVWVERVSPCTYNCPASNRVPQYLGKIRDGKLDEAAEILLETNPLPSITGRVCPSFCVQGCNRGRYDEAVSIRAVERFLGDYILDKKGEILTRSLPPENGKSVAIIGSGPCGLSGAYYLRKMGYGVVVFEREEKPGGVLTYGIPSYRLPKQVVEKEVLALTKAGVEIRANVSVGVDVDFEDMRREYDAVLLATGVPKEVEMGIPGEELMVPGLEFLKRVNEGLRESPGSVVAVIGGGNVSMDVSRTLKRLGANPVILYRRSEKEMPAIPEELEKAKQDGVQLRFLTQPVEASRKNNKIVLKCVKMRLGEPDDSGRRRPVPVEGSEFALEFDAVIKAVGEGPDTPWIPRELLLDDGWVKVNESTYLVAGNVFAAGDLISGPATVVEAVTAGREAAKSIDHYVKGEEIKSEPEPEEPVKFEEMNLTYYESSRRVKTPEHPSQDRTEAFDAEEIPGIGLEYAKGEAERCFSCGYCRLCGLCAIFCPDSAVKLKGDKPEWNYDFCKGCGICENECPCKAIIMEMEG
jgi:NADPH-dependent glutamate synthase beta subunit-like oxidoreductase/Pyruvate/2-oxoacid:ferredoxin oxidoreductase delta subunit